MFRSCLIGILAAFFFASANVAAVSNESNPVLRHPVADTTQPTLHRVLVKLRSNAASAASAGRAQAKATTRDAQTQAQSLALAQALTARVSLTLRQSREIANGLHAMQVEPAPG